MELHHPEKHFVTVYAILILPRMKNSDISLVPSMKYTHHILSMHGVGPNI